MAFPPRKDIAAVLTGHHEGDIKAVPGATLSPEQWPAEWLEVHYKDYSRLGPTIALEVGTSPDVTLADALARRCSAERFDGKPLSVGMVETALNNAVRERRPESGTSRAYPSAGALYPVEIYLLCTAVAPLESGVYHYRADRHELTLLFAEPKLGETMARIHGQDIGSPSMMIALSASLQRNSDKYGARGYRFALLEMGACAFGLDLALTTEGMRTRWIGGFDDACLAEFLGISVDQELELPTLLLAAG